MKNGYVPLYRKYRPQKIDDVIGQSHIKTALKNEIELNKVSHAYLFTGPRGTGKTSTARILAKSLNCVNGPTLTPCDECESCKSVINSIPIDVIEIDAASNRSVEDAQNILEKVQYAPTFGKYKIYIIDEIHMLSNHAFNALLKTLEEPPSNVVFIFATTEAHKVPDTIKSRCQRFDFRRITTDDIIEHLRKISDAEKINISDAALKVIAQNSSGCMRDSLALLDQVSILGVNKEISEDDINSLLGRISFDLLYDFAEVIISSNPAKSMEILEKIYHNGNEPVQILTNLLYYFKNLLVTKTCAADSLTDLTGLSDEQNKLLIKQSKKLELHQVTFLINKTADYIREMKLASNQHIWLDVAIIDLSNLTENTKLMDLQNRLLQLESGEDVKRPIQINYDVDTEPVVKTESVVREVVSEPENVPEEHVEMGNKSVQKEEEVIVSPEPVAEMKTEKTESRNIQTASIRDLWTQILKGITSQPVQALFIVANPVQISKDGIIITFKAPNFVEKANNSEKKDYLAQSVTNLFGVPNIPITIRTPLPDDVKQDKVTISNVKKNSQPVTPPKQEIDYEEEIQMVKTSEKVSQVSKQTDKFEKSDQANLVKQLFDGKFIE